MFLLIVYRTQKIVDAHCAQVASRRETAQVEGQYPSPEGEQIVLNGPLPF